MGEGVEVEDCLSGGEAEFFQMTGGVGGFFLQGLEVFAEEVEAGRDAEIDHDHVGGLREVVADGGGGGDDVVLGEAACGRRRRRWRAARRLALSSHGVK